MAASNQLCGVGGLDVSAGAKVCEESLGGDGVFDVTDWLISFEMCEDSQAGRIEGKGECMRSLKRSILGR